MHDKLQIYFQPAADNADGIKSLTISYYEFDIQHRTYKEKIVLEKDGEKYKIKRYMGTLTSILNSLENLDLSKRPKEDVDFTKDYYHIKFGDNAYATNDTEKIRDILDFMHFDKVMKCDLSEYQKCD